MLLETPATSLTSGSEVGNGGQWHRFQWRRSALRFVDKSTDGSSLFGDVARVQLVRDIVGDSEAARAWAGAAMAQVQREIDQMWRESMREDDRAMSQRFAKSATRCIAPPACWSTTTRSVSCHVSERSLSAGRHPVVSIGRVVARVVPMEVGPTIPQSARAVEWAYVCMVTIASMRRTCATAGSWRRGAVPRG